MEAALFPTWQLFSKLWFMFSSQNGTNKVHAARNYVSANAGSRRLPEARWVLRKGYYVPADVATRAARIQLTWLMADGAIVVVSTPCGSPLSLYENSNRFVGVRNIMRALRSSQRSQITKSVRITEFTLLFVECVGLHCHPVCPVKDAYRSRALNVRHLY